MLLVDFISKAHNTLRELPGTRDTGSGVVASYCALLGGFFAKVVLQSPEPCFDIIAWVCLAPEPGDDL